MHQRIPRQIIVNPRRCAPNRPAPQMREQKLGPIHHIHGNQLPGLHALLQHKLPIATCIRVRLRPGIAARAAPDGLGVGGEAVHLRFELVPQRLAFARGVLLQPFLVRARAQDPADVFAQVEFRVDVGGGCGGAGECACCDGDCGRGKRCQ